MKGKAKGKDSEVVFREGKPAAVILDIDEYRGMLERMENLEDLRALEAMRSKPLDLRSWKLS